jgi:hypothetical protein
MGIQYTVTAAEVLAIAAGQVGYNGSGTEDAPVTKYGAWYGLQDQWCAMFEAWCFAHAGDDQLHYAYCPTGVAHFQSGLWGSWHGPQETAEPGDIFFWDYGLGRASHTGICEVGGAAGDLLISIQGNTTDSTIGRTGNCCRRKQHYRAYMVGFGRPNYSATGNGGTTESGDDVALSDADKTWLTQLVRNEVKRGLGNDYDNADPTKITAAGPPSSRAWTKVRDGDDQSPGLQSLVQHFESLSTTVQNAVKK